MPSPLLSALAALESGVDALKARYADLDAPLIVPFRGHAAERRLHIKGRVLNDPGVSSADPGASLLANARDMLRRFESDEVAGARVRATFGTASCDVTADDEGYFRVHLDLDTDLPADARNHRVRLDLLGAPHHPEARATAEGDVLAVMPTASYGVISDIDDTVLQTGATRMATMLRNTLFSNARTRLPFPGVAAFYRALAYGTSTTMDNPVFYVSSSPWNLYDMLTEFLDHQGLPTGPLFLRDLGLTKEHLVKSAHNEHKLGAIRDLLTTYPDLPFVLIGDSGQHDPEIYAEAVEAFPGRIRAVYIRDVSEMGRDTGVGEIAARVAALGVPFAFAPDSLEAARHACEIGLLDPTRLSDIEADAAKDTAPGGTAV